jgi:hypothetical protein
MPRNFINLPSLAEIAPVSRLSRLAAKLIARDLQHLVGVKLLQRRDCDRTSVDVESVVVFVS